MQTAWRPRFRLASSYFALSLSAPLCLSLLHLSQPVKGSLTHKQRKVSRWPLSAKVVQRFSIKFNLLISIICASSDCIAGQHTMKIYILYSIVNICMYVWDKGRKLSTQRIEALKQKPVPNAMPRCCPDAAQLLPGTRTLLWLLSAMEAFD